MSQDETIVQWVKICLFIGFSAVAFAWAIVVLNKVVAIERNTRPVVDTEFKLSKPPEYDELTGRIK